jgi:hypothetical protein
MNSYFDIGIPARFGSCHIGLFQPVENRCLLTLCNIRHAQEIALIISGRYPVFLVDLTSAENYQPNLIDNLCCENWTLPREQVAVTHIRNYARILVEATQLIHNPNQNPDLEKEKQYLQMIWHYLKRLDDFVENGNFGGFGWDVKRFMTDIFDLQDSQYINFQNLKKQIMSELFLGRDLDSVKISVENIIANAVDP